MSRRDWKTPFLNLRDQLRPVYDANERIYHGVLMAPHHDSIDVEEAVSELEAAFEGKKLVRTIDTPTDGCSHHAHYYFGSNSAVNHLGRSLVGIEEWIQAVPETLIPEFQIPIVPNQVDCNLVRWANLVYFLAWEIDTPYLGALVEYQALTFETGFFPWIEWPQPPDCDPRPWRIHQGDGVGRITSWESKFCDNDQWLPEIIDAFLQGDLMIREFLAASLTAIDCLVYMLEQVREKQSLQQNEFTNVIKKRPSGSCESTMTPMRQGSGRTHR